jgi:hypothetical protein
MQVAPALQIADGDQAFATEDDEGGLGSRASGVLLSSAASTIELLYPALSMYAASGIGVALALFGGCDYVLRLDHVEAPRDGVAADDAAGDAGPDAPDCPLTAHVSTLIADATITSLYPDTKTGALTTIGVAAIFRGLWMFDLPGGVPIASYAHIELRIRHAAAGDELACGGCGQGLCNGLEAPGALRAHAMRADWDESIVTWNERSASRSWHAPGADTAGTDPSTGDRSMATAAHVHVAGSDARFVFAGQALLDVVQWIAGSTGGAGGRLAVLVTADPGGGEAIVASREYACASALLYRAVLTVSTCAE